VISDAELTCAVYTTWHFVPLLMVRLSLKIFATNRRLSNIEPISNTDPHTVLDPTVGWRRTPSPLLSPQGLNLQDYAGRCCVSVDSLCQTAAAEYELAVRCLGAVVCVVFQ